MTILDYFTYLGQPLISYFLLFKIYNIIGEDSEGVQRKIYELFKLSSIKKLSDFGVRTLLIKLICANNIKNEENVRRYTYRIEEQLELIREFPKNCVTAYNPLTGE